MCLGRKPKPADPVESWRDVASSAPPTRQPATCNLRLSPYSLAMRILSGIQPSGALHLGNYFGMMKPAIELQEQDEAFYFIANYHSMTSLFDADLRRKYTMEVALDFLARSEERRVGKECRSRWSPYH